MSDGTDRYHAAISMKYQDRTHLRNSGNIEQVLRYNTFDAAVILRECRGTESIQAILGECRDKPWMQQ